MKIIIPATSANLGPGFDALGLALQLYNHVKITESKITSINIKGEGSRVSKVKCNNMFVSIFYTILKELINERPNYRFEFLNEIPFSRGLGSSSAVIVGAIASAYYLADKQIDKNEILNKALKYESHPDNIAPAVFGGFCSSIVFDNKVFVKRKYLPSDIQAVVVIPNTPMSTSKSRQKLPKKISMEDAVSNLSHSAFLTATFFAQDWDSLAIAAKDRLHEKKRMSDLPQLFEVKEIAIANKALMCTLSGSGSSFLNIVYKKDATRLSDVLMNKFPEFETKILDFNNFGFKITKN